MNCIDLKDGWVRLQLIGLPPTDHDGDQITYLGVFDLHAEQVLEVLDSDNPILCMYEMTSFGKRGYEADLAKCERDGTSPRILFMDNGKL